MMEATCCLPQCKNAEEQYVGDTNRVNAKAYVMVEESMFKSGREYLR